VLNALVQELSHPSYNLPAGTPMITVFEQMGGALLILGAPGAGKTTLLLELARDLIARAEQRSACAERIFLRKVGGGYIFVHRLLMEHSASRYQGKPGQE